MEFESKLVKSVHKGNILLKVGDQDVGSKNVDYAMEQIKKEERPLKLLFARLIKKKPEECKENINEDVYMAEFCDVGNTKDSILPDETADTVNFIVTRPNQDVDESNLKPPEIISCNEDALANNPIYLDGFGVCASNEKSLDKFKDTMSM